MNRRGFLKLLGRTSAVMAVAPAVVVNIVEENPVTAFKHSDFGGTDKFPKAMWPGIQQWYGDKYAKALAESMRKTKEEVAAKVYLRNTTS